MQKTKFIGCLLSMLLSLGLLCSCDGKTGLQGPQGEQGIQGIQGPQGEQGPAGKDGSSFLTGKGQPSSELGKIGDSYLDIEGEEWGFYIKGEDGWELLGFIETEPAPLDLSSLNGSYVLSHIIDESNNRYEIGDNFNGDEVTTNMHQIMLENGIGTFVMSMQGESISMNIISIVLEENTIIITCNHPFNSETTMQINASYQTIGTETYISFMFGSGACAYLKKV